MNKQGRRTVELLDKLNGTRKAIGDQGPPTEGGDVSGMLEMFDGYIAQGEQYQRYWEEVVHYGGDLPPSDALAFKREWVAWGKDAMQANALASLPPDQLRQVILASREE